MEKKGRTGFVPLAAGMALFVVVGIPLVGYAWETLNQLLSGRISPTRLLATLPVLALMAVLLVLLSRRVRRWEARHVD